MAKRKSMPLSECGATVVFIVLSIGALVLLTNLPLLFGYLYLPRHLKFMGIAAGIRDANIYLMMMSQGEGTSPILENFFRPNGPSVIYHGFFWFFLGKLAYWFNISHLFAYHFSRVLTTVAFVPAIYTFTSRFLKSTVERWSAIVAISFGAGAGWIMMIWYHWRGSLPFSPVDIADPEASAFYTFMTFPHLSVTLILILLCMMWFWDTVQSGRIGPGILAGVCGLVIGFIHTFNIAVIYLVLAIFFLVSSLTKQEKSPLRAMIIFGGVSVWAPAYYLYIMVTNPGMLPMGTIRSPAPFAYLVGFAPFALAAAVRLGSLVRKRNFPQNDLFLLSWVVGSFLVLYSYPMVRQEARAVLGLQLPLVILGVRGLFLDILPALDLDYSAQSGKRRKVLAWGVILSFTLLCLPSSFYTIMDRVNRLKNYPEQFSLTEDEYDGLKYLCFVDGKEVVLSGEHVGIHVPYIAHKRAWWSGQHGHPLYVARMMVLGRVFDESITDYERFHMLLDNRISFLFYGKEERNLGGFQPGKADYLRLVFENPTVKIYRTKSGPGYVKPDDPHLFEPGLSSGG